jgi:hypothetical protein
MVSVKPRQLYSQGRFVGFHWIAGWVDPTPAMESSGKKFLTPDGKLTSLAWVKDLNSDSVMQCELSGTSPVTWKAVLIVLIRNNINQTAMLRGVVSLSACVCGVRTVHSAAKVDTSRYQLGQLVVYITSFVYEYISNKGLTFSYLPHNM